MWIVCPSCQNRYQVEPAAARGNTFRARCSRCESRFDVDIDTGAVVGAATPPGVPTPRPPTRAPSGNTPPSGTVIPPNSSGVRATTTGGSRRPAELEEILREIDDRYDELMKREPFALLGVHVESTNQEVMDAYFRLAERYRTSRWVGQLTDDESHKMWQLTLRIDEAFNELGDVERRRRSHQMRTAAAERKVKTEVVTGARAALIKEQLDADQAYDTGHFEDARSAYQRCIALAPERGFFHLRLGQTMMKAAVATTRQPDWLAVERSLEKATQLDPDNLEVLMALGEMWNSRGQPSRAMPYFKRVRDLEPGHGGANAAIESYLSGKQAVPARRTTTERLFKFLKRE
ncbi:MAG: zinc-ribbon domain-containing protein [Deltaproteobacteria bacterium]|nr:zinc-ribbon domain-containing protein [Deltaproteobacteria bacterium]